MLHCYTARLELDSPASAVHCAAILDHHAALHPAVTRFVAGQPALILTFPAETLGDAVQTAVRLVRATGHRPLSFTVVRSDLNSPADPSS